MGTLVGENAGFARNSSDVLETKSVVYGIDGGLAFDRVVEIPEERGRRASGFTRCSLCPNAVAGALWLWNRDCSCGEAAELLMRKELSARYCIEGGAPTSGE